MTKMIGMMVRVAGDTQLTGALAESALAMELRRVQHENEQLKAELKATQDELGLLRWAREQENERRLSETRAKMKTEHKEPSSVILALLGARLIADEIFRK